MFAISDVSASRRTVAGAGRRAMATAIDRRGAGGAVGLVVDAVIALDGRPRVQVPNSPGSTQAGRGVCAGRG